MNLILWIAQVDMVKTPTDLSAVEAMIKAINSEAVILHTQYSQVDIKAVLDRGVYRDAVWSERWSEEGDVHEGNSAAGVRQSKGVSTLERQSKSSSHSNRPLHSSNLPNDDTLHSTGAATQPDGAEFSDAGHVRHGGHSHTDRAGITTLTLRTDLRIDLER